MDRLWRVHAIPAVMLLLFGLAMHSPAAGIQLKPEYDASRYPVGALAALQDPSLRIFTDDEFIEAGIPHQTMMRALAS